MPTALNDLLKATSRSFYLTLRVLPARVRRQISLARRFPPIPSSPCRKSVGWIRQVKSILGRQIALDEWQSL
jgi:hypothetical protein